MRYEIEQAMQDVIRLTAERVTLQAECARLARERDSLKASYANALNMLWRFADKRKQALKWAWGYRRDVRRSEHWESISRRQRNEVMAHNDALRAALQEIAATATQGAQITAPLAGRVLLQIERTARAALETS